MSGRQDPAAGDAAPGNPLAVDLAARSLGGIVLAASDEYFAPKERLLDPGPPVFDPHAYTDRGKLMDGWESRRQRAHGPDNADWALVRLGVPGIVHRAVVDTSFFRGNYPESFTLDAMDLPRDPPPADAGDLPWEPLIGRRQLSGDSVQVFVTDYAVRASHVRLRIFPDGGVARLRLLGDPLPDLRTAVGPGGAVDLAATVNGGTVVAASDAFFSPPRQLLAPGGPADMGGGWETRRRRGPGHDWTVVRLAAEARIGRVEIDTTHFTGNHPERCSIDIAHVLRLDTGAAPAEEAWQPACAPVPMQPHARHAVVLDDAPVATHVRLGVHPDGGVARLRVLGIVTEDGWRDVGIRRLNALAEQRAADELRACCASGAWVAQVLARRPFADFAALLAAVDAVWTDLGPDDWREAFAAHPRIGDRQRAAASAWTRGEQAGTATASADVMAVLAEGNRRYEERFGHVFLICATGLTAEQMLASLQQRLGNDPAEELANAAEEQRKITRLRLEKLMRPQRANAT